MLTGARQATPHIRPGPYMPSPSAHTPESGDTTTAHGLRLLEAAVRATPPSTGATLPQTRPRGPHAPARRGGDFHASTREVAEWPIPQISTRH